MQEASNYVERYRRRRKWQKIVICLACIAVFCTAYVLILPAITMEKYDCGLTEHTHTEACYTKVTQKAVLAPTCTFERLNLHEHTVECFDEEGNLICGKQEEEEHVHSESCLLSTETETQAAADELTCTIPTGEGAHSHSKSCYNDSGELICKLEESEGHKHGPLCYGTWELTCTLPEHTHTKDCYSDPEVRNEDEDFSDEANTAQSGSDTTGEVVSAEAGTLNISLLYGDEKPQSEHPDGVSYYTHSSMSGYIRLEPSDMVADMTDVTVTLSLPKKYVEKDTFNIPTFSTNSSATQYEILPLSEDGETYSISIRFSTYDKTQTLVLPFTLSFLDNVVPDNYKLPVTASVSGSSTGKTNPSIYKPLYKPWEIEKFVNANNLPAFARDGAEVVVTPKYEDGNPYLSDLTYVDFAFIVNKSSDGNYLADYRDACEVTLTDTLPEYTDKNGVQRIAVFDADKNPGWTLSADGTSVSKTYQGENSADILKQIYKDKLHLRFPELAFKIQNESLFADLLNSVHLAAIPSNEAKGETRPSADDPLLFRLTNDPSTSGALTKWATKGNIYDVGIYKTNPYPWGITLGNNKVQPLRHIMIQDRKITEDGEVILKGLDEALKFVRLESGMYNSRVPSGMTFEDIVEKVVAYYTDGTTEDFPITQVDSAGNFSVTFNENKVCNGYDIIFRDEYEMQGGEAVNFLAYTVYRDPESAHVPEGEKSVTYTNAVRSVNSYPLGDEMKYVYLYAGHSYDMLPSTEALSVSKLTLCNDGNTTLVGRGGNHVGDYYMYEIRVAGSLLTPDVKEYEDLRIIDLLPDGVTYDSIYLVSGTNGHPLFENGNNYQPEIIENYHNSGRTAVIFHVNADNLQKSLKETVSHYISLYFWVQISPEAHSGTVRNYVYVVGDNLDEYQGHTGGTDDIYDLNNNDRNDDQIAYGFSDATIIAAQSMYAEKFIAPAGSENWTKQGLSVKPGADFDYLLKITNETAAEYTGLTLYDTLPRLGDKNIFGTSDRNSEFGVKLRGAITPPEGYTVLYTTSSDVYQKSMKEMADADIWTDSVTDYSAVTAFKLVAEAGTVLTGHSSFQVRIPVKAPTELDDASRELLHQKEAQNQDEGTMSYLEAINSFGFKADQFPLEKESNDVWVRIPFAGFCVKKIDSETKDALSGAQFTLTDASGNVIGTAVSDADGLFSFSELTEGVYTLTETRVPDGYVDEHLSLTVTITQNKETMRFSISLGKGYEGSGTLAKPFLVENHGIPMLPETGGFGVTALYTVGLILTVLAAGLWLFKKRLCAKC